jgi:serine/threonine protein kinase
LVFFKVVLRDILESPSHIYIVQDYIDGPNLFERIAQIENYTEYGVSKYSFQILKGLQVNEINIITINS